MKWHVVLVSRAGPHGVEEDTGVMIHSVPHSASDRAGCSPTQPTFRACPFSRRRMPAGNRLEDSVGAWNAVSRLARQGLFDVVEAADFSGLGFWGTLRLRRPAPILIRSHGYLNRELQGWDSAGARFQLALEAISVRHADFVLAVSAERVTGYQALFGVKPSRIGHLPLGLSISEAPRPSSPVDQGEKAVTILYIGRVELRKGCDVLFEALRSFINNILRSVQALSDPSPTT